MASKKIDPNPIDDACWRELSPLARSMIQHIVYIDSRALASFVEGTIYFKIGNRKVYAMTPAPDLKPGHGLPHSV
jgi:hypothetical protein